jgi:hypothetical protein
MKTGKQHVFICVNAVADTYVSRREKGKFRLPVPAAATESYGTRKNREESV